jgi:hypothetical protein
MIRDRLLSSSWIASKTFGKRIHWVGCESPSGGNCVEGLTATVGETTNESRL